MDFWTSAFGTLTLTLLANFDYRGLQVQNPATEEWDSINCVPGFVINNTEKRAPRYTQIYYNLIIAMFCDVEVSLSNVNK